MSARTGAGPDVDVGDPEPDFTQSDAEDRRATLRRERPIDANPAPEFLCVALRPSASLCVKRFRP
jgi:hypothetical protein